MSQRPQDHQEQEANPQLTPHQDVQDQVPVHQPASPAAALQRAQKGQISNRQPADILALQKTIGNRAVQRLVADLQPGAVSPGAVQRHISPDTEAKFADLRPLGDAIERTQGTAKNLSADVGKMKPTFNTVLGAAHAARDYPVPESTSSGPDDDIVVPSVGGV